MSLLKVIREKCLDCCCGSTLEVRECNIERCPLHAYRMGKNPYSTRTISEEQKEKMRLAREAKKKSQ